ncbi:MAG: PEGA domain-containing protein, partial [Bradymonadaceae bacterium]
DSESERESKGAESGGTEGAGKSDDEASDSTLFSDSSGSSESSESTGSSAASQGEEQASASESGGGDSSDESSDEPKNLDIWGSSGGGGSGKENSSAGGGETDGQKEKKGFLSVQVQKGWGKVYVDGNKVASETPLVNYAIEPGEHVVKVYYPVLKRYSEERTVEIKSGETTRAIFNP